MAITKLVITGNTTAVGISSTPIEVSLAHTAKSTSVDPDDNITATNVQSALEELDDIKVDVTDGALTDPTISGTATVANLDVSGNTEFTGLTTLNQCLFNGQTVIDTNNGTTPTTLTKDGTLPNESASLFVNDTDLVITSTQDNDYGGYVFKTQHYGTNIHTRATLAGNGDISFYEDTGTNVKFFWDSSSSSLGIGTATPGNTLTVGDVIDSDVDQDATVGIKCDENDKGIMLQENGGDEQWAIGVDADGDLNFYDSDTADPVIVFKDATSDVGISTNTPHHKLHVHGGDIMISSDTGTSTGDGKPALLFSEENPSNTDSDDAKAGIIYDGDGQSDDANYLGLGVWDTSQDDQDTLAEQKATTTLNITRDNKVGIGTNTPDSILHCKGSVNSNLDLTVTNEFDDDNDDAPNPTARLLLSAAGNDGYLEVHGSPDDDTDLRYLDLGTTQPASDLTFSPVGNEAMRIRSGGYVMIGTNVASARLHVKDAISSGTNRRVFRVSNSADGNLTIECDDPASANATWSLKYKTGSALAFGDNDNEYMRITSAGKVGINTNNPTGEFTVGTDVGEYAAQTVFYGQNNADNTSSIALSTSHTPRIGTIHSNSYYDNAGTLIKTDATETSNEIIFVQSNGNSHGDIVFGGTSPNSTTFNESMRLKSNGSLRIGDFSSNSTQGIMNVFGNSENIIQAGHNSSAYKITLGVVDNNIQSDSRQQGVLQALGVNADLVFRTSNSQGNATEAMRINGERNIGISTAPVDDVRLVAAGVIRAVADNALGYAAIELQESSLYSFKTVGGSNPGVRFDIDTTDSFKIHDNGKVNFTRGIRLGSSLNTVSDENLLDDYEEGTWTPTIFGNTSGSITGFNISSAKYTKVGRLVTIQTYISAINDANDNMVGEVYMGGLPFSNIGAFTPITTAYANMFTNNTDRGVFGYIESSSSYIKFTRGSSISRMTTADRETGSRNIMVTATYMTS